MNTFANFTITTPKGNLQYCFVSGKGSKKTKQAKNNSYMCTVIVDRDEFEASDMYKSMLMAWEDAKAKGAKGKFTATKLIAGKPYKTSAIRLHTAKTDRLDDDENPIYEPIKGKLAITFASNTEFNGKVNHIKVTKPTKDDLGEISNQDISKQLADRGWSLGTGSIGYLHGTCKAYEFEGNFGVLCFLSLVQTTKLVPYKGNQVDLIQESLEEMDVEDIFSDDDELVTSTEEDTTSEAPDLD